MTMKLSSSILALAIVVGARVAWLLACGPFVTDLRTVETIAPPHLREYARGELGVVRQHFARRFLVQAYRGYAGQPPLANPVNERSVARAGNQTFRRIQNYQHIANCLDDAFASAERTLKARVARYGEASAEVRDWRRAQDAVFSNCGGEPLVLPEPAPATADPLVRADRAYQTAAAYFYALQYEEAARRFLAIAGDGTSPWRMYGRYLAARAMIRQGTVLDEPGGAAGRLAKAESELKVVIDDSGAKALHASARGLLDYIAARTRPIAQVQALASALSTARQVSDQQMIDYQLLMDRLLGDTTTFDYAAIANRAALVKTADLNDWIVAMQGTGPESLTRALERWKATRAAPWLVAVLWKVPPSHRDTPAALEAAERIGRDSPAFATVAFLRVRLLAGRGNTDEARRILATLPTKPERGFPPEAMNLLTAQRFIFAADFDELLANAPRTIVSTEWVDTTLRTATGSAALDEDAGRVFSERLPLERLIEASLSTALPDRLRVRVAAAAFTRTLLLGRYADSGRVLPVLEQLAPAMRSDLRRFAAAATDDDRHIATIMLLLRTPGLDTRVRGMDDTASFPIATPSRRLDHALRRNWWCGADPHGRLSGAPPESDVLSLLYPDGLIPYPSFLTADERKSTEQEMAALSAIGPAPNYLSTAAVKWARARPNDIDAAEALARAVEGGRWGCGDQKTSQTSRRAFQVLHQLFPKTEWARRTKYWY